MQSLKIDLEHCYGIRKLKHIFDFSQTNAVAVYAPNGAMKSSLAKTFRDIANRKQSSDRMFPDRANKRVIVDENDTELDSESILIVQPYDEDLGSSKKTSTLLVNADLRKKYEALNIGVDEAKNILLTAMQEQSGSKRNLEAEISSTFTPTTDQLFNAILRIAGEVENQPDAPFADIPYDLVFDPKVVDMLGQPQVQDALGEYVERFNELIDQSIYFKKETFTYYNASTIAKSLADNGFFDATHSLSLNADEKVEVTSREQLEKLITQEKEQITSDDILRKKFADIEKLLHKNVNVRRFNTFITNHEDILSHLKNVGDFKEKVWKSFFVKHRDSFNRLINEIRSATEQRREIEEAARNEQTAWREVIDIFNDRFFVPFELNVKNLVPVMLGQDNIPKLGFTFKEREARKEVEKDALLEVLSTGERRAFYILNIIFEIRVREKEKQKTLIIVDDVADSFDYKNKFAIIQYLKDISEDENFRQIILTHNFDFFRTVQSRFVRYKSCFMAARDEDGIELVKAVGIKNIFVNDWKVSFGKIPSKRIASIPFMRNLVEFTKGTGDADYEILTSLLHIKENTRSITDTDLFDVYKRIFGEAPNHSSIMPQTVLELIYQEADRCLGAASGANFENKVVLSIATRLRAEQYMLGKIMDTSFLDTVSHNQTTEILKHFRKNFPEDLTISTLDRVVLMTPENIHLNSFMYEPILDMSDEHLRKIYCDVKALCQHSRTML